MGCGRYRRRRELRVVLGAIPVAHPLPHIAADVIESVAVGRKLRDGRDAREAVGTAVAIGKVALMAVGHPCSALSRRRGLLEFIAPGKDLPRQSPSSRKFPLGFSGKPLACPFRVSNGIFVRDVHDRMFLFPLDRALGPSGWRQFAPLT